MSQHRPLSASVALPWRCEALEGTVQVKPAVGDLQFFFYFSFTLKGRWNSDLRSSPRTAAS